MKNARITFFGIIFIIIIIAFIFLLIKNNWDPAAMVADIKSLFG